MGRGGTILILNRWTSPDSVIPDNYNSLDWDRYQYVRSNPVRYTDPTGHMVDDGCNTEGCALDEEKRNKEHNPVIEKLINEHEKDSQFNLGGNTNSLAVIPTPNPPLGGVIIAGVVLTTGIVISEWLLFQAEVAVAGLMVAGTLTGPLAPLAEVALVGLEAILVGCSLTLIDIEVAYISYAVRIYENPTVKQEFEFLPPWGLTR